MFSEFQIYLFRKYSSAAFFRTVLEDASSLQTIEIRHCHFQICTVLQFRVILDLFEVSLLFAIVDQRFSFPRPTKKGPYPRPIFWADLVSGVSRFPFRSTSARGRSGVEHLRAHADFVSFRFRAYPTNPERSASVHGGAFIFEKSSSRALQGRLKLFSHLHYRPGESTKNR